MNILEKIIYILQDGIETGIIWSLLTIGVFISFRVLDFADLTAEGSITLGCVITIRLLAAGYSIVPAILLSIVGGFIAGAITGILHTKFKVPPILSGIVTMTGLYSINLRVLGKASDFLGDKIETIFSILRKYIDSGFVSKTLTSLMVVVIVLLLIYWFFGTEIGMSLRATGINDKMARAQGINTNWMVILGLAISNAIIALGGSLIAQYNKTANMDVGRGAIVIGLASIILGEVLFGKRSFKNWLISIFLGSIVFEFIIGIAILLGLNAIDLKLLQASIISIILIIPIVYKWGKKKLEVRNARIN